MECGDVLNDWWALNCIFGATLPEVGRIPSLLVGVRLSLQCGRPVFEPRRALTGALLSVTGLMTSYRLEFRGKMGRPTSTALIFMISNPGAWDLETGTLKRLDPRSARIARRASIGAACPCS